MESPPVEPSYCIEVKLTLCEGCDAICSHELPHLAYFLYFSKSRKKQVMKESLGKEIKLNANFVKQFGMLIKPFGFLNSL